MWSSGILPLSPSSNSTKTNDLSSCGSGVPVYSERKYVKRGSYMSAHVLLNLLNELGKRDKRRGLRSILYLFRDEFNKFNNTRAQMLDSIYHMTLRYF